MHWTYHQGEPDPHLCQGDILLPTPALTKVFESVHRHFADPKYLAFMVTTQSCDLVRRRPGASPKAAYISVATIRSLVSVWPKLLRTVARPLGGSFFSRKDEDKARDLFKRIVDQNEQALGVFYLHRDADVRKAKVNFGRDPDVVRASLDELVPRTLADDVVDLVIGRVKGRLKPSDDELEALRRSLLKDRELRAKLKGP